MSAFRRVNRGRWHSYEADGHRVPGVTTLLGAGVPKPNLIGWAARVAAEYAADHVDEIARLDRDGAVDLIKGAADRSRNRAALRGTAIHQLAEQIADGHAVNVPDEHAGHIDAYLRYIDDWHPETIAVEGPILSRRWQYAGTFDWVGRLHGDTVMVDIKTGATGVWPETCLQLAAYRHAEVTLDAAGREVPMHATSAGYALWLSDDGTYELLPCESGPEMFAVFLHACHVGGFMGRKRDDLIGLPLAAPEAVA